jgi:hypothetical protein
MTRERNRPCPGQGGDTGGVNLLASGFNGFMMFVSLAVLALEIFALVDAAIRPDRLYRAADKQTKVFWLAILAGAIVLGRLPFIGLIAIVASIVYLVDVRPKIRELQGRGGSASGPYGPW